MIDIVSKAVVPVIIASIMLFGLVKRVSVYDCFVDGAKEGLETTVRIVPSLIGLLVAISMLRASGALDLITYLLSPVTTLFHIPREILPLALMRPISGSGSIAIVTDLIKTHGPDSFIGNLASVMMGSTETTFYTLAVYFGAAKVRNSRYTLPAALSADLTGIIVSIFVCKLFGF